jgi:hypothetical protein
MLVDPDVIGIIIALFAFTATVLGGVSRMLAKQSRGLYTRFDNNDDRFTRLETQMTELRIELTGDIADVRVSIARLEGPLPKLQRI